MINFYTKEYPPFEIPSSSNADLLVTRTEFRAFLQHRRGCPTGDDARWRQDQRNEDKVVAELANGDAESYRGGSPTDLEPSILYANGAGCCRPGCSKAWIAR